jgi:hypothetical protein
MKITHYAIFYSFLPVPPSGVGKIWQTKESRDQFQTSTFNTSIRNNPAMLLCAYFKRHIQDTCIFSD